jgi:hypothetical protein
MYWIVIFSLTVGGAVVHLLINDGGLSVERAGHVGLLWLGAVFYGAATLLAGLQHLINPDRIADYIGWARDSGFQIELGWAEVGIGVAGLLGFWFGVPYVIAPCVTGAIFYLGAGFGHAREIARHGNLSAGNAGPVFYIDILAPFITMVAIFMAHPWTTAA